MSLREAGEQFIRWFGRSAGYWVWSQGGNFDDPMLSAALRAVGLEPPWKFWNSQCTRTVYRLAGLNFNKIPRSGTHHNALDDAIHQVACVQRAFRTLGLPRSGGDI